MLRNTIAIAALVVAATAQVGVSQTRAAALPAEVPPASYGGKQYVDSKGCVFVRAGSGATVNWVPRMTRDREPLCGYEPTRVAATQAPSSIPVAPLDAPVITVEESTRTAVAAQSAGTTSTTRATTQVPAPITAPVATATSTRVAVAPPKPVSTTTRVAPVVTQTRTTTVAPAQATQQTTTTARVAVARQVSTGCNNGTGTYAAPCGLNGAAPVQRVVVTPPVAQVTTQTQATVTQVQPQVRAPIDPNPNRRAVQNQTAINNAGEVLLGITPAAPYSNYQAQTAVRPSGYAPVWEDDRLNPRRGPQGGAQKVVVQQQRVVTTRPAQPTRQVATGGRYVQVGTFGVASNAHNAAARLRSSGLPVATQNSRGMTVVMIGPVSGGQVSQALNFARRAGFGDAFVR